MVKCAFLILHKSSFALFTYSLENSSEHVLQGSQATMHLLGIRTKNDLERRHWLCTVPFNLELPFCTFNICRVLSKPAKNIHAKPNDKHVLITVGLLCGICIIN